MDAHQLNALAAVDCVQVCLAFSISLEKVHFKAAISADLFLERCLYLTASFCPRAQV